MILLERKRTRRLFQRILSFWILVAFLLTSILPSNTWAQTLNLPPPGTQLTLTPAFTPLLVKGLTIHPDNPLKFDFIVDTGDKNLQNDDLKNESTKLIKYFLASLTIPEDELWVNLSPYEKNRIISDTLGQTEMGRDMLAQDYILKQITSSLVFPENELGKKFWEKIYAQTGTMDIPMDTLNRVWIVPEKAVVYEKDNSAFVVESHLKVMLQQDIPPPKSRRDEWGRLGGGQIKGDPSLNPSRKGRETQLIEEIILPAIEKEVNEGEHFATLRQIYNSLILASWFKDHLKTSLLGQVYVNKNKTAGVEIDDPTSNQKIYDQYLDALKTGVYNYIKDDYDPARQQIIPRKYFSGGEVLNVSKIRRDVTGGAAELSSADRAIIVASLNPQGTTHRIEVGLLEDTPRNRQALQVTKPVADAASLSEKEIDEIISLASTIRQKPQIMKRPSDALDRIIHNIEKLNDPKNPPPSRQVVWALIEMLDLPAQDFDIPLLLAIQEVLFQNHAHVSINSTEKKEIASSLANVPNFLDGTTAYSDQVEKRGMIMMMKMALAGEVKERPLLRKILAGVSAHQPAIYFVALRSLEYLGLNGFGLLLDERRGLENSLKSLEKSLRDVQDIDDVAQALRNRKTLVLDKLKILDDLLNKYWPKPNTSERRDIKQIVDAVEAIRASAINQTSLIQTFPYDELERVKQGGRDPIIEKYLLDLLDVPGEKVFPKITLVAQKVLYEWDVRVGNDKLDEWLYNLSLGQNHLLQAGTQNTSVEQSALLPWIVKIGLSKTTDPAVAARLEAIFTSAKMTQRESLLVVINALARLEGKENEYEKIASIKDALRDKYIPERERLLVDASDEEAAILTRDLRNLNKTIVVMNQWLAAHPADHAMISQLSENNAERILEEIRKRENPLVTDLSLEAFLSELEGFAQLAQATGGLGFLMGETWRAYALLRKLKTGQKFNALGAMPLYETFKYGMTQQEIDWDDEKNINAVMIQGVNHEVALEFNVEFNDEKHRVKIYWVNCNGTPVFLIRELGKLKNPHLSESDPAAKELDPAAPKIFQSLYQGEMMGPERARQYAFFGRAYVELMKRFELSPDIVRMSEPQMVFTAIAMENDRNYPRSNGESNIFVNTKIVMTTHTPESAALPVWRNIEGLKKWIGGDLVPDSVVIKDNGSSRLEAAQVLAEKAEIVNAVSKEHEKVTQLAVLPQHRNKVTGIQNGSEPSLWYPPALAKRVEEGGIDAVSGEKLFQIRQARKNDLNDYLDRTHGKKFKDPQRPLIALVRRIIEYKEQGILTKMVEWITGDIDKNYNTPLGKKKGLGANLLIGGHARDPEGHRWVDVFKKLLEEHSELRNKFIFVEDTGVDLMQHATQASDLWLVLPRFTREASGTSDERTALGGGLNITTDTGGPLAYIEPGKNGWLIQASEIFKEERWNFEDIVRKFDAKDDEIIWKFRDRVAQKLTEYLEEAIGLYNAYLEDPERNTKWIEMMEASFLAAHREVSIEVMMPKYGRLYESVLDGTGVEGFRKKEEQAFLDQVAREAEEAEKAATALGELSGVEAVSTIADTRAANPLAKEDLAMLSGEIIKVANALKIDEEYVIRALALSSTVNREEISRDLAKFPDRGLNEGQVLAMKEKIVRLIEDARNIDKEKFLQQLEPTSKKTRQDVLVALQRHEAMPDLFGQIHDEEIEPENSVLRILIVEDTTSTRNALKRELEKRGYKVTTAKSGEEAFGILKQDHNFVAVVADHFLGHGMTGGELSQEIKNQFPPLDVFLMSGLNPNEREIEVLKNQGSIRDFFQKGDKALVDKIINGVQAIAHPEDRAMIGPGEKAKYGGIDLNPKLFDLEIKRDGNGVPLPVNQQPLNEIKIDGFIPIIINVTPIQNLPLLLGFTNTLPPSKQEISSLN